MTRVISVGLDGAAWHKLDRLMDDGRLPNLKRLSEGGVRAPLRSVTPPVTCPAWRCSTSGKNPGKLGVFWWLNLDHETGELTTPDSNSFETADIWDYLSADGYRCAVLNVPMTFPPSELNGTMVSGFGAPLEFDDPDEPITYPPEFEDTLITEYDWQTAVDDITTEQGLEEAYDVIRSRFDLLLDLIEQDYDYIHLTVFYINMLQHRYGDGVETDRAWVIIDDYLGQIDTDDTLLVLYSDHGHSSIDDTFVINRWLMEHGYLTLESTSSDAVSGGLYSTLTSLGVSPKKLAVVARRILPRRIYDRLVPSTYPITTVALGHRINWSATDAVALSQGPLYLNRRKLGSRYEAVRDDLRERLETLTHDGRPVLSRVQTAEELYNGPFVDRAPDLILSSAEGWEIYSGIVPSTFESQSMSWTSGNHPEGILLLNGPEVGETNLSERSILDVMPTVLSYFHSSIPRDVDGDIVEDAFPGRAAADRSRDPIDPSVTREPRDDDELKRRLEDLGYLE